ncbi:MAG: hypothetical protein K1X75_04680 [Leptospirales bacterium]|nr:hypothetical protein [Leptospirales bacterium]
MKIRCALGLLILLSAAAQSAQSGPQVGTPAEQSPSSPAADSSTPGESNLPPPGFAEQGQFGDYLVTESSHQLDQIACEESSCTKLYFSQARIVSELEPLFRQRAGRILIDFDVSRPRLNDPDLETLRPFLREIAARGGRVIVEPISIGVRDESGVTLPVAADLFGVGYNLVQRIYNYFHYDAMDDYHAKALTSPTDGRLLMLYFVHRSLGDPCTSLYSRCDVIEYFDQQIFDDTLSRALEDARQSGKSVRVSFEHTPALLPEATLDGETLVRIGASARLYKWLVASGENETRELPPPGSRFLPLAAAVGAIKYSLQAYDLVQALRMYWPARSMRAEVYYQQQDGERRLQSVVFSPAATEQ